MTALEKYARLEGPGVWRAGPEAQRRDVTVALGEASLVISDAKSGQALSHWSLPAVVRKTRGTRPAVYSPQSDGDDETLELDDALLIEALETIRNALNPKPPLPLLRVGVIGGILASVVAGFLYLPSVIVARTAAIVPPAGRQQIGVEAMDLLVESASTERICADPEGRQAMATLRNRVLGDDWRVMVVAGVAGTQAAHLPGNIIVLGEELLSRLDGPDALAGWLGAEALARAARDPLLDALRYAGTGATVTLLTTGTLPEGALRGYARQRITQAPALPDAATMGAWFAAKGISPTAYALSLPPERQALAEALADSAPGTPRTAPLLSDGEWLTIQAICAS